MTIQLLTVTTARFKKCLLLAIFLLQAMAYSQVNFTDSNLPIVLITTDIDPDTGLPMEIPDDPKIPAGMKIIYHEDGSRNYITDADTEEFINYEGRIKIELRGSSSQDLPKKQYGWTTYESNNTTKLKVSILDMPRQNDWILNGLAFDPSLLRDYLSYNLSRQIGYYTVRTRYCEVVLNGEYIGLYLLQEKLKDDSNRINIEAIDEDASEGIPLTGGYIVKADKTTGGDEVGWVMDTYNGTSDFIHELPKPEDITQVQHDYIHQQFLDLETTSHDNNASLTNGYPSIIDVPTFVDFIVMNELASNVDGYQVSTFFHKDKGGKLRAGPIWDFNLTYGNDLFEYGFDRSHYNVWQTSDGGNDGAKFWADLFNQDSFKCYVSRRWHEVTAEGQPLSYNSMSAFIDETVVLITEAAARDNETWGRAPDLTGEIATLKTFLSQRIAWINNHVGSHTPCDNVVTPSLVITKINYNPGESTEFPESDDQEFIEIKNTGTTTADLTGVYIKELGISYQFPAGSSVNAGESIYLASNPIVFVEKYGVAAFGQFQRNLSNSDYDIVLADGFGNVIDRVHYDDGSPWPDADGSGMYLQLTDAALDNSLASSWVAVSDESLSTKTTAATAGIVMYPNPVSNILTIRAKDVIKNIEVYDIYGKLLQQADVTTNKIQVDFSHYSSGIYFVKVLGSNGLVTQKVVRE